MSAQPPAPNPYGSPGEDPTRDEPRRRPTGLYLAVGTSLVVLLAILSVTAFAYPGWMLEDQHHSRGSERPSPSKRAPVDEGLTAAGTTNAALDRLNNSDLDGFALLTCPAQRATVLHTIRTNDPRLTPVAGGDVADVDVDYELESLTTTGPTAAVAEVTENFSNLPKSFRKTIPQGRFDGEFRLTRSRGRWQLCGVTFTIPGAPSTTDEPEVTPTPG